MYVKRNWVFILSLILLASCFKDSYDFENFSGNIEYSPSIAAPLANGNLSIENLYEFSDSSDLDTVGSTIVYSYRKDSLFSFGVSDFGNIPEQKSVDFKIKSSGDIPADLMPTQVRLVQSDTFTFVLEDGMRLDSFVLNTGTLTIDINSSFRHTGVLNITSRNIMNQSGQYFSEIIQISNASGNYTSSKDCSIDNNKLVLINSGEQNYIIFDFELILWTQTGEGISGGDEVVVDFTFNDLNDYKGIFGFMGIHEEIYDTIFESPLEDFENLKGTFSVTNPKLSLEYNNSLGVPFDIDLNILATFDDGTKVNIAPENLEVSSSTDYLNPEASGEVIFSRDEIPNIDSLLTFPPASTFDIYVAAISNGAGDNGDPNFILKDSELNVDLVIEVPLEFRADLVFTDTLEIELGNMNFDEVDYANLYYNIENQFPINFDVVLLAYDYETNSVIDTVKLSTPGEQGLIIAAPVDENGITIIDQVQPYSGFISLTDDQVNNLINEADNIILQASISSTEGASTVKILKDYTIKFDFSLEAKATIVTGGE